MTLTIATMIRSAPRTARLAPALALRQAMPSARPFHVSATFASAVKPGSNSEHTMPGAGSTEAVAESDGAYDSSRPSPDDSAKKIQKEEGNDVDMDRSNATDEPSAAATKGQGSKGGASGEDHEGTGGLPANSSSRK